jgi:hypothetical protein
MNKPELRTNEALDVELRISRGVANPEDFKKIDKKLKKPHKEGIIVRRSVGRMALTVFDSSLDRLPPNFDLNQDDIIETLKTEVPELFMDVEARVDNIDFYGVSRSPFVALKFESEELCKQMARTIVALNPILSLRDINMSQLHPHLSLAKSFSSERAKALKSSLQGCLPHVVVFKPVEISLTPKQ